MGDVTGMADQLWLMLILTSQLPTDSIVCDNVLLVTNTLVTKVIVVRL